MAASNPVLAIRIALSIEDLKKAVREGKLAIEAMAPAVEDLEKKWRTNSDNIVQHAKNITAGVNKMGTEFISARDATRELKGLEAGMELLRRQGQAIPQDMQTAAASLRGIATSAQQAHPQVGILGKTFTDIGTQIKATIIGFVSAQAIIGAVSGAYQAFIAFLSSSIDSYAKSEAAQRKMTTALLAAGNATPVVISQYNRLASAFERTTVYSDELINEMQALLTQVGGVMPGEMDSALTAATNLASGLGVDLRQATMLVGKAFEGETGTLKRYGIVIDEAKLKAEGLPAVLDAINSKFGGQAAAEAETYAGKIKQVENAWDNFKETVGEFLVSSPLVESAMRSITTVMEGGTTVVKDHDHQWSNLIRNLSIFGKDAPNILADYVRGLEDAAKAGNAAAKWAETVANLKPMVSHITVDEAATASARAAIDALKKSTEAKEAADKKAQAAAEAHTKAMAALRDEIIGKGALKAFTELAVQVEAVGGKSKLSEDGLKKYTTAAQAASRATVPLTADTRALVLQVTAAAATTTLMAKVNGVDLVKGVTAATSAVEKHATSTKNLTAGHLAAYRETAKLALMYGIDFLTAINKATAAVEKHAKDSKRYFGEVGEAAKIEVGDISDSFGKIADIFSGINSQLGQAFSVLAGGFETMSLKADAFKTRADEVGTKMVAGFTMAAQMVQQFGGDSALAATAVGALSGAATGAMFAMMAWGASAGPVGAAVGAAIGAAMAIWQHFAAAAQRAKQANIDATEAIRDVQRELIRQYGYMQAIDAIGKVIGVDLAGAWGSAGRIGLERWTYLLEQFQQRQTELFEEMRLDGGLASQMLIDLMRTYEELYFTMGNDPWGRGQLSEMAEKANQFFMAQLKAAASGLTAMFQGLQASATAAQTALRAPMAREIAALMEQLATASDEEKVMLQAKIDAYQRASAAISNTFIRTEQQARGLAATIVGTFSEMIARGVSFREALAAVQPSIDIFRQQLEQAGLKGGAAFAGLIYLSDLAANAITGPLLDAITGVNDALKGLHNSGILNQEMFSGLAATAVDAYNQLIAAGVNGDAAMMMMQPTLQTLWQLATDFNYVLSEEEQQLVANGVAAGMVGDRFRDAADRMARSMDRVVEVLELIATGMGVDVTDAANDARDAGVDAGTRTAVATDSARLAVERWDGAYVDLQGRMDALDPTQIYEVKRAIDAVVASVARLNFGSSPGGLKEIPVLLHEAETAARSFERTMMMVSGAVYGAAEGMSSEIEALIKELGLLYAFGAGFDDFLGMDEKRLKEAGLYDVWKQWRQQFTAPEIVTRETHGPQMGRASMMTGGGAAPVRLGDQQIVVYLDSSVLARATAKGMPSQVRLYTR